VKQLLMSRAARYGKREYKETYRPSPEQQARQEAEWRAFKQKWADAFNWLLGRRRRAALKVLPPGSEKLR
jgi:hypothetical protein